MPVSGTSTFKSFAGNSSSATYYPLLPDIEFAATTEIEGTADGVALVNGVDFTVHLTSGVLTTAAYASGVTLIFYRVTPLTQPSGFPSGETPLGAAVETGLDKIVRQVQEADAKGDRSIKLPAGTNAGDIPSTPNQTVHIGSDGLPTTLSAAASVAFLNPELNLTANSAVTSGFPLGSNDADLRYSSLAALAALDARVAANEATLSAGELWTRVQALEPLFWAKAGERITLQTGFRLWSEYGGTRNMGMIFNGTDSFIDLLDTNNMGTDDMEVRATITPSAIGSSMRVFDKGRDSTALGYGCQVTAGGKFVGYIKNGSSTTTTTGVQTLVADTEYDIRVVWDRSGLLYVYIDGILDASVDISGDVAVNVTNTKKCRIGASSLTSGTDDPANFFDGVIHDVELDRNAVNISKWAIYGILSTDLADLTGAADGTFAGTGGEAIKDTVGGWRETNDISQTTTGHQPLSVMNTDGKAVARCDGVDDHLEIFNTAKLDLATTDQVIWAFTIDVREVPAGTDWIVTKSDTNVTITGWTVRGGITEREKLTLQFGDGTDVRNWSSVEGCITEGRCSYVLRQDGLGVVTLLKDGVVVPIEESGDSFASIGSSSTSTSMTIATRAGGNFAWMKMDVEEMVIVKGDNATAPAAVDLSNYLKAQDSSLPTAFRVAAFNIYLFDSTTKDAQYLAVENHIARYRPDVLFLTEVKPASRTIIHDTLGPENGYDYIYLGDSDALDVVVLSKYKMNKNEMLASYDSATELNRRPRYIELGGRVGIYGIHDWTVALTSWVIASPVQDYERAVATHRLLADMAIRKLANPDLEFMVLGDFNADDSTFTHVDSFASNQDPGEGGAFVTGSDVGFPLVYGPGQPAYQYEQAGNPLAEAAMTNIDGDRNTLWANTPNAIITSQARLDYLMTTAGINVTSAEIADSEATQSGGIVKYGAELTSTDSRAASDHKMIVADIRITGN